MQQFKTDLFEDEPPFACCLFHKQTQPQNQTFLEMLRFTFFPNFQLYTFTFFWLITIAFVYIYSLSLAPNIHAIYITNSQFLRVSQKALYVLGENYPYYIINKSNYYRLLTSTVLFRNLYHFLISAIGILCFGSFIENLVGFKRMLLLSISTGVGGEIIRDIFISSATVESLTPICGLIGFMLGYYVVKRKTAWKYCQRQRVHMLMVIGLMLILYFQLGIIYRNISWLSMLAALLMGFVFYFCDPNDQRYEGSRICAIIFLTSVVGVAILIFFFKSNPPLVSA